MTRRRLLKLSLLSGLVLSGGLLTLRHLTGGAGEYDVSDHVRRRLRCLSAKEFTVLAAVARRILSGVEPPLDATGDGGAGVALWVDGYLSRLHSALQSDVRALLQLLEHSPLLSGRPGRFSQLPAADQEQVLRDWQGSGLALRRQGLQALKSMCCLAYYQDPRSFAAIGYSPLS